MSDKTRYKALVEADCIIVPKRKFGTAEDAEAYIKETVRTGDLGPAKVRAIEVDEHD